MLEEENRLGKVRFGQVPPVIAQELSAGFELIAAGLMDLIHMRDCEKHDTEVALCTATDAVDILTELTIALQAVANGASADDILTQFEEFQARIERQIDEQN